MGDRGRDRRTRMMPEPADGFNNENAPVLRWANLAAKAALVALLAYSVVGPDLPHLAGKAMSARAVLYPVALIVVPVAWLVLRRRRGERLGAASHAYPHALDLLIALPFVIDTAGNAVDLYATVWFDGLAHAVNWGLIVTAFGLVVGRLGLARWNVAALAVGFGATTHVLWELTEYALMALGSSGLQLTYGDTIGDLGLSLAGSVAGAALAALAAPAPASTTPRPGPTAPATSRGSPA